MALQYNMNDGVSLTRPNSRSNPLMASIDRGISAICRTRRNSERRSFCQNCTPTPIGCFKCPCSRHSLSRTRMSCASETQTRLPFCGYQYHTSKGHRSLSGNSFGPCIFTVNVAVTRVSLVDIIGSCASQGCGGRSPLPSSSQRKRACCCHLLVPSRDHKTRPYHGIFGAIAILCPVEQVRLFLSQVCRL